MMIFPCCWNPLLTILPPLFPHLPPLFPHLPPPPPTSGVPGVWISLTTLALCTKKAAGAPREGRCYGKTLSTPLIVRCVSIVELVPFAMILWSVICILRETIVHISSMRNVFSGFISQTCGRNAPSVKHSTDLKTHSTERVC